MANQTIGVDGEAQTMIVPVEVARIIRNAFLPLNPNKMRGADPRVVAAAKEFIRAVECFGPTR